MASFIPEIRQGKQGRVQDEVEDEYQREATAIVL